MTPISYNDDCIYNGKALRPTVEVWCDERNLVEGQDYTVTYKNNIHAGAAEVTITGKGKVTGSIIDVFYISKASQKLITKAKTKTVRLKAVKKKKQVVSDAIKVSGAHGSVTYKKLGGSKKLTINKKTGRITVKKKTRKGTYKIKVQVIAAGDRDFRKAEKIVTVKVKVK